MIEYRKLYQNPTDGERTCAVVAYREIPWIEEFLPDKEAYRYKTRHFLQVDLWVVVLSFDWVSKWKYLNA